MYSNEFMEIIPVILPLSAECSSCTKSHRASWCCSTCYTNGRHKLPQLFECFFCSESCYNVQERHHKQLYHQYMKNFPQCLLHKHVNNNNSDTESENDQLVNNDILK